MSQTYCNSPYTTLQATALSQSENGYGPSIFAIKMSPDEFTLIIILIICCCVVRIKRLELRTKELNRDVSFLTLHARIPHQMIHPIRDRMTRSHFPPPQ